MKKFIIIIIFFCFAQNSFEQLIQQEKKILAKDSSKTKSNTGGRFSKVKVKSPGVNNMVDILNEYTVNDKSPYYSKSTFNFQQVNNNTGNNNGSGFNAFAIQAVKEKDGNAGKTGTFMAKDLSGATTIQSSIRLNIEYDIPSQISNAYITQYNQLTDTLLKIASSISLIQTVLQNPGNYVVNYYPSGQTDTVLNGFNGVNIKGATHEFTFNAANGAKQTSSATDVAGDGCDPGSARKVLAYLIQQQQQYRPELQTLFNNSIPVLYNMMVNSEGSRGNFVISSGLQFNDYINRQNGFGIKYGNGKSEGGYGGVFQSNGSGGLILPSAVNTITLFSN